MAYYNVDYDAKPKEGAIKEWREQNCFSAVFRYLDKYKELLVYIRKDYTSIDSKLAFSNMSYSIEEFHRYIELLKKMGFKFTFNEEDSFTHKDTLIPSWSFKIVLSENTSLMNLMFLNFIRQAYEVHNTKVVESFLSLAEDSDKDWQLWNKMIMSHFSVKTDFKAHTIIDNCFYSIIKLFNSEDEYRESNLFSDKDFSTTASTLTEVKVETEQKEELKTLFNQDKKLFIEQYKKLTVNA